MIPVVPSTKCSGTSCFDHLKFIFKAFLLVLLCPLLLHKHKSTNMTMNVETKITFFSNAKTYLESKYPNYGLDDDEIKHIASQINRRTSRDGMRAKVWLKYYASNYHDVDYAAVSIDTLQIAIKQHTTVQNLAIAQPKYKGNLQRRRPKSEDKKAGERDFDSKIKLEFFKTFKQVLENKEQEFGLSNGNLF